MSEPETRARDGFRLVLLYLLFITAHLVGVVAFFRADDLGLQKRVSQRSEDDLRHAAQAALFDAVLRRVRAAAARKDLDGAIAALKEPIEDLIDPLAFDEDLFSQVHTRTNLVVTLTQGARLIARLVSAGKLPRAIMVYRQCLDLSPAFPAYVPADQCLRLARFARAEQDDPAFEMLSSDLSGTGSIDPSCIELAVERADYLLDARDDAPAAVALLERLPDAPHRHPARGRIETLQRLIASETRKRE